MIAYRSFAEVGFCLHNIFVYKEDRESRDSKPGKSIPTILYGKEAILLTALR